MDDSTTVSQPTTGETATETTVAAPKWYTKLPEHLVPGVSKFDTEEALAEGYVNAQKLIGKRTQDLSPEDIKKMLSPEELYSIYESKGLPQKEEEYILPNVDKYLAPEVKKQVQKIGMEAGISPDKMEALIQFQVQNQLESSEKVRTEWRNEVFSKYGKNLSKELEYADRAISEFGGDKIRAELDTTGLGDHPLVVELFSKLGRMMSEDKIPHTGSSASAADNSKAEINKLLNDPKFMHRWRNGDRTATAQLDALYKSGN